MSTHDYVIDNQAAPAFRSDLNDALAAIVSQNSNATAPATTYADMLWYDTTTKILKKRNEANSAWVSMGTFDEGAGTFTPSGTPTIASQVEAEVGTNNTKMMTPLRVRQGMATQYESAETTITSATSGSYTFTHGLGATPKRVRVVARCKTAESTFSVGDEVDFTSSVYDASAGGASTTIANATNIKFHHYYLRVLYAAGNSTTTLTAANWKIVAYASL